MKRLFATLGILLLTAGTAFAQTPPNAPQPIGLVASSNAMGVDLNGNWSAGTLVSESFDIVDFGPNKANHVSVAGNQFLAPTPGFSLYTGGVIYEPDLTSILGHTNVPKGAFTAFVDGSVGSGVSSNQNARFAWLAGGGVNYDITGNLSWKTIEVQYGGIGAQRVLGISTGISYLFGREASTN